MGKGRETYRKIITSPELTAQINSENIRLMERFLKNFATKRSPKSVIVYRSNLMMFFTWNLTENGNVFFCDIRKIELAEFFDYCVEVLKWNPNRFSQMHSCLSSFSTWIENMYDDKYPTFRNLLPKIEKPVKDVVRKKSVFTKEELDNLMNWLGEINKPQEQCLLALMMSSGSRVSELTRFTIDSINENSTAFEDLFLETTEEIQIKGRGINGKKELRYIIKDTFLPYYKKWLPIREKIMQENNKNHNSIFITSNGNPAQTATIRSWIEKWDKVLDKHLYPHSLRHYFVTQCIRMGLEPDFVKEIIAWSSSDMVGIYNDMTLRERNWKGLDKLKSALEKSETNN
ncbi:MAG: site-specific integrase [Lachnospiraceae bacterium]|nr:site-specific integrase [Lachnospiraceae bacterium]